MKLKTFLSVFFTLTAFSSVAQNSTTAGRSVLLTAFEPFDGLKVNNSASVMAKLSAKLRDAGIDVTECILPVEYDRGAKVALQCKSKMRSSPALVLSMGTGGCRLEYETRAENRDQASFPDNAGVLRDSGAPIMKGKPEFLDHTAPMSRLYKSAPILGGVTITESTSMGNFVCNNTAYWLDEKFAKSKTTRFGFIHVPSIECEPNEQNPEMLSEIIFKSLQGGMPELF